MKLNDLPVLDLHFFVKPNTCIICDANKHTIIKATIEENINEDFCIDAKSFNIIKKLCNNRSFKVENNTLIVNSDNGKYTCQNLDKKINWSDGEYETSVKYNVKYLKNATKYVALNTSRPTLCGVIVDDLSEVFGTDSFRIYYEDLKKDNYATKFWSLPPEFVNNLYGEEIWLYFNSNKVYAKINDDFEIVSNLYAGSIPDFKKVIFLPTETYTEFDKPENISLLTTDTAIIKCINNKISFIFNDEVNSFVASCDCVASHDFEIKVKTSYLLKSLERDKIIFETHPNFLKVNDNTIIMRMI